MPSSLPVRGAWIETVFAVPRAGSVESLPVRGAWIEMFLWQEMIAANRTVAPRAGSVD